MRIGNAFLLSLSSAAAIGCANSDLVGSPGAPAQVQEQPGRIAVGPQSSVCVSVQVDQRVWPVPHLPDADGHFSTFFAGELARVHRERGGAHYLPGPEQIPRFMANAANSNPFCQDADDIAIDLTYAPRADGKPFSVALRIERGSDAIARLEMRDIEEEWRTGRLARFHHSSPLADAISNDMRARAAAILNLLNGGVPWE
jgi:hypothetical protein